MRFATLFHEEALRTTVHDSLTASGIEVLHFRTADALIAGVDTQPFAAILVEDHEAQIKRWLEALRVIVDNTVALMTIGAGGATAMSRALVHGADDYVVVGDGAAQLLDRAIARISTKIRRLHRQAWQLGPYTLDLVTSRLISPATDVRLTYSEAVLARLLIESHDRIVTTERLCLDVCGRIDDAAKVSLKQHAYVLRKKFALAAGLHLPRLRLDAVYRKGYRLAL